MSCDQSLICAPGTVTDAALPQPTKLLAESALPTANLTRVLSACVAAVVPLEPLVEGPPPVPSVLEDIVPTLINSLSINIKSLAVMPVALSTSIAVSLASKASLSCVAKAPDVVPLHCPAPHPVPPTVTSRPVFI